MHKNWELEASFSDFIISCLLSCKSVKMQRQILYKLVQKRRLKNQQIFNSNLHRLKNKGLISFDKERNVIINRKEIQSYVSFRNMKVKPTGEIQILVLFDVPERKRKIRNWLRLQLKLWNFKMIQQSSWIGDGPLPKEFLDHLRLLDIQSCVKTFKIQKNK